MNSLEFKSQKFWDFLNTYGNSDVSLYFHIPFCEQKCLYCDFYSKVSDKKTHEKYIQSLIYELSLYKDYLSDKKIVTIFIGGGTPSAIDSKLIYKLFDYIGQICNLSSECEITIESNPNSILDELIKDFLNSGINRISMGAQSFNCDILKKIGRIHSPIQIYNALNLLQKNNIKNFNIDLMMGLPNQNLDDLRFSIEVIKEYEIPHVSYYSLILEEETPLYNNRHNYKFPTEDTERIMYKTVLNDLDELGIKQYEISNFSKPGYECKHNLRYWNLKDYIGIGCSAQSNIGNIRYSNVSNLIEYLNLNHNYELELLNDIQRLNEYNMLKLRLNSGIDIIEASKLFNIDYKAFYSDAIKSNLDKGLINFNGNKISLTSSGKDLSNLVELDFTKSPNK